MGTDLDARFFETTRGRIISILRSGNGTVNEMAAGLGISDNAVRAHLLALERDGLVRRSGTVKGFRKPHYVYALTRDAGKLFPRPYDSLFSKLISVLKGKLSRVAMLETLQALGRSLAVREGKQAGDDLDSRVSEVLSEIESLGGKATAASENGTIVISSASCPFADAVSEHPEVCKVTEALIEDVTGRQVRETCDRSGEPKCRFEITAGEASA
jgi:predicted ArsR family transcriptional regulator